MKSYIDITSRYLKGQIKRTILAIIGIILSVALITGIGTIIVSMRESMIQEAIHQNGDYYATLTKVDPDKVNLVRNHVGVKTSALRLKEGDAILAPTSPKERGNGIEISPYRYFSLEGYDKDALEMFPVTIKEGRFPEASGEIALESWAMEYLSPNVKIGDTIELNMGIRKNPQTGRPMEEDAWSSSEIFQETGKKKFTIVGLIQPKFISSANYFASAITYIDDNALEADGKYDISIKLDSIREVHKRISGISSDAGLIQSRGYTGEIRYNEQLLRLSAQSLSGSLNSSMKMVLAFIVALVMISTIAVIYNVFHISVLERVSQFGILRCVGGSPSQITRIVLKEALILSVIGIPLGILSGVFAMKVVFAVISLIDSEFVLANLPLVISPAVCIISSLLGIITVFLSAYGPARQAARVSPLEAVRNAGSLKKENLKRIKKTKGLGLLLGIEGQMAWKNIRRNRKRFIITVFSMVISIVLYIVFGSLVHFTVKMGVADPKETGDYSLWKNIGSFTDGDYNQYQNLPGVETVFKYMNSYAQVLVPEDRINPKFKEIMPEAIHTSNDDMVMLWNNAILSYGDRAFSVLGKSLKAGSADARQLNKGNGVLLVKTGKLFNRKTRKTALVDLADIKIGDTLSISMEPGSDGNKTDNQSVTVMGILDKGILNEVHNENGGMYLITTEEVFQRLTGREGYNRMYIKLRPNADKQPVSLYLKEQADKIPGFGYTDYAEAARANRTSTLVMSIFLYGFVAVITLIGSLNIINTVSTNLILRTREISMLKAVGMTQWGIRKMVGMESMFYGIIAAFYGGIIGTVLSYGLFHILIGVREFAWSIPWNLILTAVTGAAAVALLSAYFPLRRINKGIIMDNIRMEE